ncbi:hypothetical protein [Thermomonas fusca]|uniref:hypothetical protein n=1 Tax=Thermomonas fusca TaxID=215690 RepID=UPI0012EC72A7|nr:hypothetical protein [Thermomonas fusca]
MKKWTALLGILISAQTLASEPRLMNQAPDGCKFIKQESCQTSRSKGVLRCEKWHKVRASKAGANVIVIVTTSSQQSGGAIIAGALYTSNETTMTADYYACPTP